MTESGLHSGTLFPDDETVEQARPKRKDAPQPGKQRTVSWKSKLQKAVDRFTGTLYDMNKEMNDEEI